MLLQINELIVLPFELSQCSDNTQAFEHDIRQLDAFENLRSNSIQILGFAQLSKNTYNPNKAKINTQIVSGID